MSATPATPSSLPPAVILAGGAGRRMGGNKPFHVHEGRPLIDAVIARLSPQVCRLFVNCGPVQTEALAAIGLPLSLDDPHLANLGPLSGVHAALRTAADFGYSRVVTTPCDMPALPADMVARLMVAHDETVACTSFTGARDYPLCALWNVTALPVLEAALDAARTHGGLAVMGWLKTQKVRKIAVSDDAAFVNINQPTNEAPRS